jgi:hypothetical protein
MRQQGLKAVSSRKRRVCTTNSAHDHPWPRTYYWAERRRLELTRFGLPISPTFRRPKVGCSWLRSWISTAVKLWAGQFGKACALVGAVQALPARIG